MSISNIVKSAAGIQKAYEAGEIFYFEVKEGKLQRVTSGYKRVIARIKTQNCWLFATSEEQKCHELFQEMVRKKEPPVYQKIADFLWTRFGNKKVSVLEANEVTLEELIQANIIAASLQRSAYSTKQKRQASEVQAVTLTLKTLLKTACLIGAHRTLDPELIATAAKEEQFQKFLEICLQARVHNINELKNGNFPFNDPINKQVSELYGGLLGKINTELLVTLVENTRCLNFQVHNDNILGDLNIIQAGGLESRTEGNRQALNGYEERDKNLLLQRSAWNNVQWGSDGQFLKGERLITFMTKNGHKVEFTVPLDLTSLNLTKEQTVQVLAKLKNQTKDDLADPQLEKILDNFTTTIKRNMHIAVITAGHGPIKGLEIQGFTYSFQ